MATKSKKRKEIESVQGSGTLFNPILSTHKEVDDEIFKEMKKLKRNDSDASDSKEQVKISMKKSDITSIEKLLKDSEDVYEKFVERFEQKEEEQDRILQAIEADIASQKQEEENFLKHIRQVATVIRGDEKVEKIVENLEKECADMKEKVRSHEKLKKNIEDISKENEELKKLLEENKGSENSQAEGIKKQLENLNSELKDKERKEKGLQSIVELYYSLTSLKISTDYGSQDPISEFHCRIKGDIKQNEIEFKLKDNDENEIEYNPVKCRLSKEELAQHSYLQEEIVFDMDNLKKFFKTVYGAVNNKE